MGGPLIRPTQRESNTLYQNLAAELSLEPLLIPRLLEYENLRARKEHVALGRVGCGARKI